MAQMIPGASAAVLAGGRSSRFGSNKALAPWRDRTLVENAAGLLAGLFPETLVVVKKPEEYGFLAGSGVKVVADGFVDHHSLGGLRAALANASAPKVFVCACDMPFLSPELIRRLLTASHGYEAAVPVWNGRPQPLCAVYSKNCLGVVSKNIKEGNLRVRDLFEILPTRFLLETEIEAADPQGRSFFDLDTPQDYAAALRGLPCWPTPSAAASIISAFPSRTAAICGARTASPPRFPPSPRPPT